MQRRSFSLFVVGLLAGTMLAATPTGATTEEGLALQGYDPVAYFTEARAMRGDPRFEHEFDGAVYRFASSGHMDMFQADPERYLPQFGNLCTMSLSRGEIVVADPEHWTIHEGRLHIFGRPIGPGLMAEDPDGIEERARSHWAALPAVPGLAR